MPVVPAEHQEEQWLWRSSRRTMSPESVGRAEAYVTTFAPLRVDRERADAVDRDPGRWRSKLEGMMEGVGAEGTIAR